MTDEPTFDVTVHRGYGQRDMYSLRSAPKDVLEDLAAAIARELGDRTALRAKYPRGYRVELEAMLKTKVAAVKASMTEIREMQRTMFVLTETWVHVDTEPES
jgi:hypothetical protein